MSGVGSSVAQFIPREVYIDHWCTKMLVYGKPMEPQFVCGNLLEPDKKVEHLTGHTKY